MTPRSDAKPTREWELEDMENPNAAIREVLLLAFDKYEREGEPVILTTDEINAEVIRKGLRDTELLKGKKKGSLIGSYGKRESLSNLSPPLFIPVARGKYELNLYYLDKIRQFHSRWRFGESRAESETVLRQPSKVERIEEWLKSLGVEIDRLSGTLDKVGDEVRCLLAQEGQEMRFVHTSPDFPGTIYGGKITTIKEMISGMLRRAEHSVRISTRQMDMFEDELLRLKRDNPHLQVVVVSRGPQGAEGPRKRLAGVAFEQMKEAGVKLYIERHTLHSRMILIDEKEVLVSSADLDYTQMEKEFNAGVWTDTADVVAEAVRFFDNLLGSPTVTEAN